MERDLMEWAISERLRLENELQLWEVAWLELPGQSTEDFVRAMVIAASFNTLKVRKNTEPMEFHRYFFAGWNDWVSREDYRQWREKCPKSLLSGGLTQISKWLDEAPAAKADKPPKLPEAEIKARLLTGESIQSIHSESGTPKHVIQRVKKKHKIANALPGPRPRCSD